MAKALRSPMAMAAATLGGAVLRYGVGGGDGAAVGWACG